MPVRRAAGNSDARRGWRPTVAVVALIAGPFVLYQILPLIGVSAALASGAVAVIALKHLGLLAVLFAPLYGFLRHRRKR